MVLTWKPPQKCAHVSIPVIAVDRINTPELAEQTIAQGKAVLSPWGAACWQIRSL